MISVSEARQHRNHCASCRYQTIETIALARPSRRVICSRFGTRPHPFELSGTETIAVRGDLAVSTARVRALRDTSTRPSRRNTWHAATEVGYVPLVTQIVVAGNWSYAVVVADRRFTVNGALVDEDDDEHNKLILIATPTARFGVAFCGLAALGPFRTESWLSQLLHEALLRGGGTPDLNWMCERATTDFTALPQPRNKIERVDPRCLWVVLAGFVSERKGAVPTYAFFGNAQPTANGWEAGSFGVDVFGPSAPAERTAQRGYAMSFGAVAVDKARVDELRGVIDHDRPAHEAIATGLRVVAAARSTRVGTRLIGTRCGAICVWSERERQPEGWYFGARYARTHFMPTLVTRHGIGADIKLDRDRADRKSSSRVRGTNR